MTEAHPTPGVGAVIVEDGRLLLIRRGRGAYRGYWAVPGGRQRRGETMRDAVIREVREETGLAVEVGGVVWAGDIMDDAEPPVYHYTVVDFSATPTGGRLGAGDDAAEVRWVPLEEVRLLQVTPTMEELLQAIGS